MSRRRFRVWLVAAIVVAAILFLVYQTQPSRPGVEEAKTPAPASPSTSSPAITPVVTVEETSCKRPYPDSSIWNVPVDWSIAKIHPMSDLMIRAFFKTSDWIGADPTRYTPNIYWVTNATPLVPVQLLKNRFRDAMNDKQLQFGQPAGIVWVPLPVEARPAEGTDGQLVVINVDTGEEWGLNKGSVDGAGNWFAGGIYRYHIENSGVPPEGFGQRGAGIGQLAGIVRRCEVERGHIDHAVTIAYNYPCEEEACVQNGWPASIPPFRKTDGRGTARYDLPEGARLAIRPEISRQEITDVCSGVPGCIVWVLNMQEYGGFIVDNSDHPKTYAEGDATANWDSSVWTRDMLRDIPMDWYIVIDWNSPSTGVQQ